MTLHLSRFGFAIKYWPRNTFNRAEISIVIWYPRGRRELGFLYPSFRLPF
jgi:hypothetical protein